MPDTKPLFPSLAFDATGAGCFAALRMADGRVLRSDTRAEHGHAAFLIPMLRDLCGQGGIGFSDLVSIAVVSGPGGFTGTRIGLAAVRTIARLTNIRCFGINGFDLLAWQTGGQNIAAYALDTRRGDAFVRDGNGVRVCAIADIPRPYACYAPMAGDVALDASDVACVFDRLPDLPCGLETLSPVYVRDADTSTPKHPHPFRILNK